MCICDNLEFFKQGIETTLLVKRASTEEMRECRLYQDGIPEGSHYIYTYLAMTSIRCAVETIDKASRFPPSRIFKCEAQL